MEPKMITMSTLTGLVLWTAAAQAAPSLSLSGECGAWVTANVTLDAEGDYRMIWGDAGMVSVPMGHCEGTEVGVLGPASPMRTAAGGSDETAVLVAGERCTKSIQVIDLTTCEVSPVVSLSTLPAGGYAGGYEDGVIAGYDDGYDDGHADGLADGGGPSINCFQSGFCFEAHLYYPDLFGPFSAVGPATEAECLMDPASLDAQAWLAGSFMYTGWLIFNPAYMGMYFPLCSY